MVSRGLGRDKPERGRPQPSLRNDLTEESPKMKTIFQRFVKDESGATAIEYGLIASLVAVAIIAGATALGTSLNTTFNNLSTKMK
jgi:pilus assembly protein Flp/PilA